MMNESKTTRWNEDFVHIQVQQIVSEIIFVT